MKLHLGCGKRIIPGFVHVDLADYEHIDHKASLNKLPFEDSSASLIYCCHALTYYDRFEIENVLHEWKRVLKPGGIVRISVTDFDALLHIYHAAKHAIYNTDQMITNPLNEIIGPLFGRWEVTPGSKEFIYHKTVFTYGALENDLCMAGFNNIRHWDWRETEHTNVDDYSQAFWPHMNKESGIQVSLNVEATK
jgi:ubiquinone/menaquinone biosynthesis C-methylase UbiE